MVGKFDIARCGPCCSYECLITDGDQDGQACSGTWSRDVIGYTTPNHATTAENTIWYDETDHPSGVPWQVSATLSVEVDDQDPSELNELYAGSYEILLIGAFEDCNNYVFVRVTEDRPLTGTSYVKTELGIMIDGVETILAEHVADAAVATCIEQIEANEGSLFEILDNCFGWWTADGEYVQGGLNRGAQLELCWDGETLVTKVVTDGACDEGFGGATSYYLAAHKVPGVGSLSNLLVGRKAGFGTGAWSAEVNRVIAWNFDYSRAHADDSEGTPCGDCVKHCCGSPVPGSALVEIAGSISGDVEFGSCSVLCEGILGTWTVTRTHPSASNQALGIYDPSDCNSDAWCLWSSETFLLECQENEFSMEVIIQLWSTIDSITGERELGVWVYSGSGEAPLMFASAGVSTELPCDEMTDWITLTVGASGDCDTSSLTIRVKMVP